MTKAATLYEPIIEDPPFQLHSRKSDMYGLGTEKFFHDDGVRSLN